MLSEGMRFFGWKRRRRKFNHHFAVTNHLKLHFVSVSYAPSYIIHFVHFSVSSNVNISQLFFVQKKEEKKFVCNWLWECLTCTAMWHDVLPHLSLMCNRTNFFVFFFFLEITENITWKMRRIRRKEWVFVWAEWFRVKSKYNI